MPTSSSRRARAVVILALVSLGGCAVAPSGPFSVVASPGQGKTFELFQADDASCRQYAEAQTGISPSDAANQSLVGSGALGTALGAAAGAAIGAAAGNPAAGAATGAASGLGLGTASGAGAAQYSGSATQNRYDVSYAQCMSAKGENVQQAAVPRYGYPSAAYGYPYYAYPAYPYYSPGWFATPAFLNFGFGFGGHHGGYHGRYHERFHGGGFRGGGHGGGRHH
jgi:hypothetical protein